MKSAKSIIASAAASSSTKRGRCCSSLNSVAAAVINMKSSNLQISNEMATKLFLKVEEDSPDKPTDVASLEQNSERNRWFNVLPFDDYRIKLKGNSEFFNDYINASRVYQNSSSIAEKSYILTQGPVPETIGHFWTMVWQQEVSAIVMLCRLTESGTPKCASYWPQTEEDDDLIHVPSAGLEVRLRDCDDADQDYLVSNLEVRDCRSDTIRVIPHYHYMTWPDFGVPESTSTFLRFLQLVNARHPSNHANPILVHCSAGIGRSGTFILVDSCLDRMKESKKPMNLQQITDVLLTMRGMRGGLIQTPEQLKFSLQAIQDIIDDLGIEESSNGILNRKRSTDLSESNESSVEAKSPPKRPKANC